MDSSTRLVPASDSPFEIFSEALPRDDSGAVLWPQVFEAERPLRIEIGVGTSTFLLEIAERFPEFSYVGLEYSAKRVAKFLQKARRSGATNIRMLRADAARWLSRLFLPSTIDHFYVHHPDPWPKRRHEKKRFVSKENSTLLANLLRPGGGLSLRTDFAAYAQRMLAVLDSTEGLENLSGRGSFSRNPRDPIPTLYETKFLRAGQEIFYLEYARISSHDPASGSKERQPG